MKDLLVIFLLAVSAVADVVAQAPPVNLCVQENGATALPGAVVVWGGVYRKRCQCTEYHASDKNRCMVYNWVTISGPAPPPPVTPPPPTAPPPPTVSGGSVKSNPYAAGSRTTNKPDYGRYGTTSRTGGQLSRDKYILNGSAYLTKLRGGKPDGVSYLQAYSSKYRRVSLITIFFDETESEEDPIGLRFQWIDWDGNKILGSVLGKETTRSRTLRLAEDEWIVRVRSSTNLSRLCRIEFLTNKGTVLGPFGFPNPYLTSKDWEFSNTALDNSSGYVGYCGHGTQNIATIQFVSYR